MQDNIIIFPEPPSGDTAQPVTRTLPVSLTPMIGREYEVKTLQALLLNPDVRLLSLTGPGGVGKTRLALEVARDLAHDFADGIHFISLAPISDPAVVIPTIAHSLGLMESGSQPLLERLKTSQHDRHRLLLLDNFEQVVSAAPQLVDLLTACAMFKLLVTSREVLHVRGEQQFAVPPLAVPDPRRLPNLGVLSQYEAVALFISRVQAVQLDFQVTAANARAIAEICTRLDGLPLAIELAAARVKLFSPQVLLARLDQRLQVLTSGARDAPVRQQSLRNTLAWSYDLLHADEQCLFRRLSVFVGGCTLEAVEAISAALDGSNGSISVLEGVASLIDKSLVQRITQREEEESRFVMLETIREYGLEVLAASGEMEVTRRKFAEYFMQYAEAAALELDGPQQTVWLERLTREHENMRAVLQWSLEQASAQETEQRLNLALQLASGLRAFWVIRGFLREGLDFLEQALARGEGIISTSQRARTLDQVGGLLRFLGDSGRAEVLLNESLRLRREIADTRGIAATLHRLGTVARDRCDLPAARSLTEEALALFREQGNQTRITWAISQLGEIAREQGDYNKAYSLGEECLARNKAQGNMLEVGNSLCQLAKVLFLSKGDLEMAHSFFEEGLALLHEVGDYDMSYSLVSAGQVDLLRGDLFTARLRAEESVPLARESGDPENLSLALALSGQVNAIQGDLAAARACYEEGFKIARQGDLKGILASSMEGLASVVVAQGAFAWAARLWGAAEALRERIGTPLPPVYRHDYEQSVAAAHTQLGEQPFVAAWTEGRDMTEEQAFVARGPVTMPTPVSTTQPVAPPPVKPYPDGLTAREKDVLRLLAQGLTSAQIAEQLVIGLVTVNSHVRSIYSKLGVTSRSAATRYVIEHNLL